MQRRKAKAIGKNTETSIRWSVKKTIGLHEIAFSAAACDYFRRCGMGWRAIKEQIMDWLLIHPRRSPARLAISPDPLRLHAQSTDHAVLVGKTVGPDLEGYYHIPMAAPLYVIHHEETEIFRLPD